MLSGTDVGAPITNDINNVVWTGKIGGFVNGVSIADAGDFHLNVFFNGAGGLIKSSDSTGNLQGTARNVSLASRHFTFTGSFGASGVLTGRVESSTVSDFSINNQDGTFNGIIGQNGLLAVFKSDVDNTNSAFQYAGAFAAVPSGKDAPTLAKLNIPDPALDNGTVEYNDWSGVIPTVAFRNGFLPSVNGALGINEYVLACIQHNVANPSSPIPNCETPTMVNLNLGTATYNNVSLSDDTDSGVVFYGTGIDEGIRQAGNRSYAGILDGTDLGAPLADNALVGEWQGQFKSIGGYYFASGNGFIKADTTLDKDFTLTVTFGAVGGVSESAGSIEAFVSTDNANRYFYLKGTYDNQGVITGTTQAGFFIDPKDKTNTASTVNGVLTGLIGVDGAVGAFVSNQQVNYNYAGGFVATYVPPVVIADGAGYTAFKNHYSMETGNKALLATAPTSVGTWRGFLQGTPTGLVETGITFQSTTITHFDSIAIKLGGNAGNEDSLDGFAVLSGRSTGDRFGVGLLSGTDLGAPLPTEAAAIVEWTGSLYYANGSSNGLRESTGDFTLMVDVNEGTLTTKTRVGIPLGAASGTDRTIAINGRFGERLDNEGDPLPGHLPVSILGGTVSIYTDDNKGAEDPLIGLIGEKGVLGVFRTSSLVGGFEASGVLPSGTKPEVVDPTGPTGPVGEVTGTTAYQAWANSFDTGNAQAVRGDTLRASNYTTPAGASADYIRLNDSDDADEIANNIVATNFESFSENTLRLNDAQLSSDAGYNSGAVFGYGFDDDSNYQLYAGLLPTTDLGAPITDGNKDGIWAGTLAGYDISGASLPDLAFHLKVTFENVATGGTVKSTSSAGVDGSLFINGGGLFYAIDFVGRFDRNGVMSGTANGEFGNDATGTFNGLIGQDGAVGVFKGINGAGDKGYVGGFQVKKP